MFAAIDSTGYRIVVLLHIATAFFGFAAIVYNATYLRRAAKNGATGAAIVDVVRPVMRIPGIALIAVSLLFGFAAMGMSEKVYSASQTWAWVSSLLVVVVIATEYFLLEPTQRKLATALQSGSADAKSLQGRLAAFTGIVHLSLVIILAMMIWKPGV